MSRSRKTRRHLPWAALLSWALLIARPVAAEPDRPRNVLVLYGFDPFSPSVVEFDAALRSALAAEGSAEVSVLNEILDPESLVDPVLAPKQHAWFQERYRAFRPEVLVAVGVGALEFALAQRDGLWPGIPVLYTGVEEDALAGMRLPEGVTGIARQLAADETLRMALKHHPGTRRVALISGTGAVDRAYAAVLRQSLARVTGDLEHIDIVELSVAETADRLAALPDHTIVLGMFIYRDGTGRSVRGAEAMRLFTRRSRAPIYSTHSLLLGTGVVGGWITDFPEMGRQTGRLVASVLARPPDAPLPPPTVNLARPVVDEQQLERWHVPESRLPPGTTVLFREISSWRRYRRTIAAVVVALLVESFLIAFLLLERRRRRAAEAESRANLERIAHVNRVGTIAELSGSLAHELNGPLGAIVNNARAAGNFLRREQPDLSEVHASLVDIEGSADRASQVIRRLRTVLRKDGFRPERLDVAGVVADAVRLVQSEASLRRVTVDVSLAAELPTVDGDEVLLLQVLLNLLLNALDAVTGMPAGQRTVTVEAAAVGRTVELAVSDSGAGIPVSALEGVFEPFFTTKPQALGMGLAICRSIAQAHGGRVAAGNRPEGGAVVRVSLPAAPAAVVAAVASG